MNTNDISRFFQSLRARLEETPDDMTSPRHRISFIIANRDIPEDHILIGNRTKRLALDRSYLHQYSDLVATLQKVMDEAAQFMNPPRASWFQVDPSHTLIRTFDEGAEKGYFGATWIHFHQRITQFDLRLNKYEEEAISGNRLLSPASTDAGTYEFIARSSDQNNQLYTLFSSNPAYNKDMTDRAMNSASRTNWDVIGATMPHFYSPHKRSRELKNSPPPSRNRNVLPSPSSISSFRNPGRGVPLPPSTSPRSMNFPESTAPSYAASPSTPLKSAAEFITSAFRVPGYFRGNEPSSSRNSPKQRELEPLPSRRKDSGSESPVSRYDDSYDRRYSTVSMEDSTLMAPDREQTHEVHSSISGAWRTSESLESRKGKGVDSRERLPDRATGNVSNIFGTSQPEYSPPQGENLYEYNQPEYSHTQEYSPFSWGHKETLFSPTTYNIANPFPVNLNVPLIAVDPRTRAPIRPKPNTGEKPTQHPIK